MTPKIFNDNTWQKILAIVLLFIAFATISGLLNYAYATGEWFYGIIALANARVYGDSFYNALKE